MDMFALGDLSVSEAALKVLHDNGQTALELFSRHASGNWGLGDPQDNDDAIATGGRITSLYYVSMDTQIMVTTEPDRSQTTIMLSEEW
jgi:hypothetical protein